MTSTVDTVVVGGGQAGLAVSHYLTKRSVDHVVLEQADRPGEAWRNHRWASFTLNTPRWQSRLPGVRYGEDDPDGFMPRNEVVASFEALAGPLPVRYRVRVAAVERDSKGDCYTVEIEGGESIKACNVVVATGLYQTPKIPVWSSRFSASSPAASLRQLSQPGAASPWRRARCRRRAIGRADRRGAL